MPEVLGAVIALELRLLDPAVRADRAAVTALLHDDFLEFGGSGSVWNKTSIIEALAESPDVSGVIEDLAARWIGDGVVLVTYRIRGARSSLRSSIWIDGASRGWQIRFHQGTLDLTFAAIPLR
ncbi:MAG TPA: DUF4440 domain-containing protein [Jatrophihabitans sp.]|jgi:ribonuclease HI